MNTILIKCESWHVHGQKKKNSKINSGQIWESKLTWWGLGL